MKVHIKKIVEKLDLETNMKKLLFTLFIICFLSCDTTELNKCNINYIPGQNLINYNGTCIQNIDYDILIKIHTKLYS